MFQQVPWLKKMNTSLKSAVDRVVREKEATVQRISLTFSSIVDSSGSDSQTTSDSSAPNVISLPDELSDYVNVTKPPSSETVKIFIAIYRDLFTEDGVINLETVKEYLWHCPPGEDILAIEDTDHYNLLHKAIVFNSVPLVRLIKDYGCDVNTSSGCCSLDDACSHPDLGYLHLACLLGHTDVVKQLLRMGADVTISKRVHISCVSNCPECYQTELLASCRSSDLAELLSTCGERPPAFFGVLRDQVDVLAMIVGRGHAGDCLEKDDDSRAGDRWVADEMHSYLLHVACRTGAFRCLEYLVQFYPREVNMFDSDGLPPLLMVMKHGLAFVLLLLQSGADIQIVEHFWEEGTNILHLLYRSMPFPTNDQVSLRQVTELCVDFGASVNAERHIMGRTPLHDIVCTVNHSSVDNTVGDCGKHLTTADDDLIATITFLLEQCAKMNVPDVEGKTPLHLLLGRDGHSARFEHLTAEGSAEGDPNRKSAYASRKCGLDNIATIARLLLEHAPTGLNLNGYSTTPLMDFIQHMCFMHDCGASNFVWGLEGPSRAPGDVTVCHGEEVLRGYYDVAKILLEDGCCDPNEHTAKCLPPLLCLLSYVTGAARSTPDDFLVSPATAVGLSHIVELLLQHGAQTEYDVTTGQGEKQPITCFDILVTILSTIEASPQNYRSGAVQVLHTLAMPLIQYGAATVLSRSLLYNATQIGVSQTFLYQLLKFGATHLEYVNDSPSYRDLFTVLSNQVDYRVQQLALTDVLLPFLEQHPRAACLCGRCAVFLELVDSKLSQPRSLKQLSRHRVVSVLQFQGPPAVSSLALPQYLHAYMLSFVD